MKRMFVLFMALAFIFSMMSVVLADATFDFDPTYAPEAGLSSKVGGILGAIQWVGYAIAVGMLIYVGIKYVMSSAQEKADLKNSLVRYVIGAIIIAGASTILAWITTLAG